MKMFAAKAALRSWPPRPTPLPVYAISNHRQQFSQLAARLSFLRPENSSTLCRRSGPK
jgi:hypothetical protein